MSKSNLHSPTAIRAACDLTDLKGWLLAELASVQPQSLQQIVLLIADNLHEYVHFPKRKLLLWNGCNRLPPPGKLQRYHQYPEAVKQIARARKIQLDGRPNGPAIVAFRFAEGLRPDRSGSSNAWSIHHLYSGKYPYLNCHETLHAKSQNLHFTQSAGLVAVHPVADSISDEFPCFAWYLRAEAFIRFGYDPDHVFAEHHDIFGFSAVETGSEPMEVIFTAEDPTKIRGSAEVASPPAG